MQATPRHGSQRFKFTGGDKCAALLLALLALLLLLVTSAYIYRTVQQDSSWASRPAFVTMLVHGFKSNEAQAPLLNVTQQQQQQRNDTQTTRSAESVRQARETATAQRSNSSRSSDNRGYYEEQRPVVVHAESGAIMDYPQESQRTPKSNGYEEYPYEDAPDDYYAEMRERFEAAEGRTIDDEAKQQGQQDEQQPQLPEQRAIGSEAQGQARAAQQAPYDAYYRQWYYATPPPALQARKSMENMGGNRKLSPSDVQTHYSDIYGPAYDDDMRDYDYSAGASASAPATTNVHSQQQLQAYATSAKQSRPLQVNANNAKPEQTHPIATQQQGVSYESTLLTVLRSVKMLWDLYQAFAAAWNAIGEQHKQQHQQQKQKQQQQQKIEQSQQQQTTTTTRINSKRPTKFEINTNNENVSLITTTMATATSTAKPKTKTTKNDIARRTTELPPRTKPTSASKRAGNKVDAVAKQQTLSERQRRAVDSDDSVADPSTEVAEGRYIKGDPLRGYYDFVITEGSYKFWAVFQVGTALLIIYSTFAAIYYSKVNPLVSDYDYTDYLGGARALNGADLDFVDDETAEQSTSSKKRWYELMPRMGHSVKFILDAIDKLPVDHVEQTAQRSADEDNEEHDASDLTTPAAISSDD